MASPFVNRFSFPTILFLSINTTLLLLTVASAHEFIVGGPSGWAVPPAQNPNFYNQWASMNRFHVSDTLNFLNEADSVLVVSDIENYMQCNITDPVQAIAAGNGVFQFARYGFYYFISEQVDHCLAGQRMIVRVMVHPNPDPSSPSLAPTPPSKATAPSPSANNHRPPPCSLTSPGLATCYRPYISSSVKIGAGYRSSLGVVGALLVLVFLA